MPLTETRPSSRPWLVLLFTASCSLGVPSVSHARPAGGEDQVRREERETEGEQMQEKKKHCAGATRLAPWRRAGVTLAPSSPLTHSHSPIQPPSLRHHSPFRMIKQNLSAGNMDCPPSLLVSRLDVAETCQIAYHHSSPPPPPEPRALAYTPKPGPLPHE